MSFSGTSFFTEIFFTEIGFTYTVLLTQFYLHRFSFLYRRCNRQICRIVRNQCCLCCMIEVGFARPYLVPHQIIVAIKLVEPGAVHMVEYLLVKILHERLIIIRIFFLSGHTVKNGRSIDGSLPGSMCILSCTTGLPSQSVV